MMYEKSEEKIQSLLAINFEAIWDLGLDSAAMKR